MQQSEYGHESQAAERYSIHREDSMWVVVDNTRQRRHVGRAGNEHGAQRIASLLANLRGPGLSRP